MFGIGGPPSAPTSPFPWTIVGDTDPTISPSSSVPSLVLDSGYDSVDWNILRASTVETPLYVALKILSISSMAFCWRIWVSLSRFKISASSISRRLASFSLFFTFFSSLPNSLSFNLLFSSIFLSFDSSILSCAISYYLYTSSLFS